MGFQGEITDHMAPFQTSQTFPANASMESGFDASEKYERGVVLRKAGLFEQAVEEFEQAATSRTYTLKAYAQIGLCHKSKGRYEDAVLAFRKALQTSQASSKETVQVLYVLGRTLETLGRFAETLEAYRWIRREDPDYRDVEHRIRQLSMRRLSPQGSRLPQQSWVGGLLRSWQNLVRSSKSTPTTKQSP
jgi:tetratricopeptide (TPR) repeat protein